MQSMISIQLYGPHSMPVVPKKHVRVVKHAWQTEIAPVVQAGIDKAAELKRAKAIKTAERIYSLLRDGVDTVPDLADEMRVTHECVRERIRGLEREGRARIIGKRNNSQVWEAI